MRVILYMAATANGMIAEENDNTSFVSKVEWASFLDMARRCGNIVIGRRTYELMGEEGSLQQLVGDIRVVVITSRPDFRTGNKNHLVAHDPERALDLLEKAGMHEALLAGGGGTNASFACRNLIDEIYLDVMPVLLGKGIRLFAEAYFNLNLQLLEMKKLAADEIQLHYEVKKPAHA